MKYDPLKHHRRSIRLKNYDYTLPGAYFITICTRENGDILGYLVGQQVELSPLGQVVERHLEVLPDFFSNLQIDERVIMPDHLHAILILSAREETKSATIPTIVQNFKSVTSRKINRMCRRPGQRFWQRNYYDHVIRNEQSLAETRQYVRQNPMGESWSRVTSQFVEAKQVK